LDVISVPRDLFNSFALKVYESDKRRFEEIYRTTGTRISNAIRMLARNDPENQKACEKLYPLKILVQLNLMPKYALWTMNTSQ